METGWLKEKGRSSLKPVIYKVPEKLTHYQLSTKVMKIYICVNLCYLCWIGWISMCFSTFERVTKNIPNIELCFGAFSNIQIYTSSLAPVLALGYPCHSNYEIIPSSVIGHPNSKLLLLYTVGLSILWNENFDIKIIEVQ